MALTDPVRDRILEHLKGRFEDVVAGVDDHVVTWNTVERRTLTDVEQQLGHALALLDVDEQKQEEIGFMRADLRVITEFWIRLQLGDQPSKQLNLAMADVQRTMRSDIHSTVSPGCQLTINITEVRNELDIEGPGDDLVGGIIVWSVLYRHNQDDPTKLPGEA